ncbi:MAG TPA: hypothetical protein VJH20_05510 [Candidatus Nanoarchaeia archaeon]|nr:hypothetical protein [Candidatus Nanoarchaeia archaeon]
MNNIFEITNKHGENFILTHERWTHIKKDHPNIEIEEIEHTIKKPIKIIEINEEKHYYFHFFKHKNFPKKFLRIIVKYKNLKWLIMTAHFVNKMQENG